MRIRGTVLGVAAAAAVLLTSAPAGASTLPAAVSGTGRLNVALASPSTGKVPAPSVGFSVSPPKCFANAVTFTATQVEFGVSGVQQFKQTAFEQEFTTSGWVSITGLAVAKSVTFPNDARSFSFTRHWATSHVANGASYRVIWQGFYLNGRGAALFKTVKVIDRCLAA
jgi:hypothetical protein